MKKSKPKTIKPKPSKTWSVKTAIIAGIIVFCLVVPQIANAIDLTGTGIAKAILQWIVNLFLSLCGFLVGLSAKFFEAMLGIGFDKHQDIVEIGWKVTRDFSNMFFILFMVVIAFATILRLEQYGVRQLLPKVVLIALLINFSLVISYVIIDFSNITADFFIKDAKEKSIANEKTGEKSISATLADSLNLSKTLLPSSCDGYDEEKERCKALFPEDQDKYDKENLKKREDCKSDYDRLKQECKSKEEQIKIFAGTEQGFLNMLISGILSAIILLVAAFVLFAGGIILVIRLLFLWFLVMVVPFVFICYIMPSLRKHWQKWWSTFLSWCFFAPIYAFFVWLAVSIARAQKIEKMKTFETAINTANPEMISQFFSNSNTIISFIFIIGLLIGGLITAKQMGIYGAGAAINILNKAKQGTVNWAKRTSMRPVKALGTTVGAGALTAGGRLFGDTKLGRRMQARATQLRQRAEERPEHKKYQAVAERMSNKDLLKEVETAKGVRKYIATREAKKRGILREAERKTIQHAMKAMQAFGAEEEARTLEELRPDAIDATTPGGRIRRDEAVERAIKEGTHKKWSEKVFESPEGEEIAEELQRQLGTNEFAKIFGGWAKNIQDAAEKAMTAKFNDNFTDQDNLRRRRNFATATGKINQAFFGDQTGTIQAAYQSDPNAQKEVRLHIEKFKDDDFGKLKTNEDKALAVTYMLPPQVHGAGTKLSGRDKKLMRRMARLNASRGINPQTYTRITTADTWT